MFDDVFVVPEDTKVFVGLIGVTTSF